MKQQPQRNSLNLGGAALFLLLSILNLKSLISPETSPSKQSPQAAASLTGEILKLADSALSIQPTAKKVIFVPEVEGPFRTYLTVTKKNSPADKTPAPERKKFALKGILLMQKPLAILEDEHGETYIRGVGEKALDQELVNIRENGVVLRDNRGTYDLSVEPK